MRNRFMMVLVAGAAIVASCSDTTTLKTDLTPSTQTEKIGFVTYTEKATRADEPNSVNLYDFYKAFDVYAWKTANGKVQEIFNHTPVEHFDSSSTSGTYAYKSDFSKLALEWGDNWATSTNLHGWFYEELRYWDKLATKYNFYAIAPYQETPSPALTIADGDNNIKIGGENDLYKVSTEKNLAIVNGKISEGKKYYGFNKDYMLAEHVTTKNQLVTLEFHHILTKLNVKITLTEGYTSTNPFTIRELNIVDLEDEAYFEFDTNMITNGWTTKAGSTYNLTETTDYILKNVPDSITDKTEYSGYYWFQTLIFPQTLTCDTIGAQITAPDSKYLYIEYTIGNESFSSYYDLAYVFGCTQETGKNTYDLKQGSEYTINIKVGPDPIVFEADASTWADDITADHSTN